MTGRVRGLLIGLGAFVGLLIVVLLVAPLFIDVSAYRDQVVAEVKKATGRDLVLGGPISLRLLPTPTVRAEDVKVYNLAGSKNPDIRRQRAELPDGARHPSRRRPRRRGRAGP